MSKQTVEKNSASINETESRVMRTIKVGSAVLLSAGVAGAFLHNSYEGWQPSKHAKAPTYMETHNGQNPANIIPSESDK